MIADDVRSAADHIAAQTRRLAERCTVATTTDETLGAVTELRPEMVIISLGLDRSHAIDLIRKLRKMHRDLFIVGTYREMPVSIVGKAEKAGVASMLSHPIDFVELYRLVANRFNIPVRRHTRHEIQLDVIRADGQPVGKTGNISEGGLLMTCALPVSVGQSLLIDIHLPDDKPVRVRAQILGVRDETGACVARALFENLRGEDHRRLTSFLGDL